MIVTAGKLNVSVYFYIVGDASHASPGEPVTGLLFSDIETGGSASYVRQGAARVDLTLITLASASATHANGGFILVDDTNLPGVYRCDFPDAAFASGVDEVTLGLVVASGKNAVAAPIKVQLTNVDLRDSVRGGMTALPNFAADAAGGLPISDAGGLNLDASSGLLEIDTGTSPTATTLTLKSGSLAEPGDVVQILTSGNGVRGTRIINAFNGGTEVATFKGVWDTTPTTPITYALFASPLAETVQVGSMDPNTVDGSAFATSAAIEIRQEMDSNSTKLALLVNPAGFKKNTLVEDFTFPMRDTTGALKTGLTVTGQIAKDDGAYAAITSAITEKGTTGTYRMTASPALLAAELNADHVVLLFTAPGAVATMLNIYTEP